MKKTHNGHFPFLEEQSGEHIFDTTAIAQHLSRKGDGAYGTNHFHTAKCDEWIAFTQMNIQSDIKTVTRAVIGESNSKVKP